MRARATCDTRRPTRGASGRCFPRSLPSRSSPRCGRRSTGSSRRCASRRAVADDTTKRAFDVAGAAALVVLLAPVLAAVAIVVRAVLGSPVLFRQRRPGLHGEPFLLTK